MPTRTHRSRERGTTLLTVLIVVLAIAVLGGIAVVASGRHLSNARLRETNVGLENCALAVRQYVAAQVTGAGLSTTSNLTFTVPATGTSIVIKGGHYENELGTNWADSRNAPSFGSAGWSSIENIANAMPMNLGSGSTQQAGFAVCTDVDGRKYEVEFSYVGK
jgi:type II secretory pathway pseudopilin PulG